MVSALAPSSYEGTSAVHIGKKQNLADKDSLKFKSTEAKIEGISKSEEWMQDGPYFVEVNKNPIPQASVKKAPLLLSSVQIKLPKVDQLQYCQPPETEICRNLMPPGQRKEQMELGEGSRPPDKQQRRGENVMQREGGASRRGRVRVKLLQLNSDCQAEHILPPSYSAYKPLVTMNFNWILAIIVMLILLLSVPGIRGYELDYYD